MSDITTICFALLFAFYVFASRKWIMQRDRDIARLNNLLNEACDRISGLSDKKKVGKK